ncbi:helix-turn-helix transcriptional regulator [Rhodospirillum sp. A1_3_36]|uniref:helix-turn-helix transcriptional regulator n=1 Tax=Rhodospirillum sp. A1_3_36 TaxID=3391666 RepID=UPI0039A4B67C
MEPININDRLMRLAEVMEITSLSKTTIYRYIEKGFLKPVRFGRTIRFRASEIKAMVEQ